MNTSFSKFVYQSVHESKKKFNSNQKYFHSTADQKPAPRFFPIEIQNSLSDLQHNGFILRSDLPSSPNFKVRYELKNGTILFLNFHDISGEGIYVTFDWNYLNEEIQISKFIDPLLDGNQFQLSTVSLLTKFAYKVPQLFFDNNNLKLRAKSE